MRTESEAHVYMDQRPCACGDVEFDRVSVWMIDGGVPCSRYFGKCRTCSTMREFVFESPKTPHPITGQMEFGGSEPSSLLDPGEWMTVSDRYAKLEPCTPKDLDTARAALEEVINFLPDGRDSVPEEMFRTEQGRAVRVRDPGRFGRASLAAALDVYRRRLAEQDLTRRAIAWKHTGDAEFPYAANVSGRRYTIRVNDFPAEPLYTLIADGVEQRDLEDWPPSWTKPSPPNHLLDLLKN